MLLHRYGSVDYVYSLDIVIGVELIIKAMEEERDERIFRQWTAQLPVMAMTGEVIDFEQYKERVTGANIDRRPTEEILKELDELEQSIKKEV